MSNPRALVIAAMAAGFLAGDTPRATRVAADVERKRDPITTAQKLAKADAKRARKNAKRLYAPGCRTCAWTRKMTGWKSVEHMCMNCRHGLRNT